MLLLFKWFIFRCFYPVDGKSLPTTWTCTPPVASKGRPKMLSTKPRTYKSLVSNCHVTRCRSLCQCNSLQNTFETLPLFQNPGRKMRLTRRPLRSLTKSMQPCPRQWTTQCPLRDLTVSGHSVGHFCLHKSPLDLYPWLKVLCNCLHTFYTWGSD